MCCFGEMLVCCNDLCSLQSLQFNRHAFLCALFCSGCFPKCQSCGPCVFILCCLVHPDIKLKTRTHKRETRLRLERGGGGLLWFLDPQGILLLTILSWTLSFCFVLQKRSRQQQKLQQKHVSLTTARFVRQNIFTENFTPARYNQFYSGGKCHRIEILRCSSFCKQSTCAHEQVPEATQTVWCWSLRKDQFSRHQNI